MFQNLTLEVPFCPEYTGAGLFQLIEDQWMVVPSAQNTCWASIGAAA